MLCGISVLFIMLRYTLLRKVGESVSKSTINYLLAMGYDGIR